jgi:hypothetical protein
MATALTTDEAVMDLLVKVEQKKEEIKKAKKKPQWKTNCSIGADADPKSSHDRKNIQVMRTTQEVMEWYAFLLQKREFLRQAADELGITATEADAGLSWMAYSIQDWLADLKSRVAQLTIEQKQAEVKALDARVNKLVSPDQRRSMELEALQQILG